MENYVSIILILHNRHRNLNRLLEYYKSFSQAIFIADSSKEKHQITTNSGAIKHLHTPNHSFTQKIETVLAKVETPFVVMCADDDFIIEDSIYKCVNFLNENVDYAVAQGMAIQYNKYSVCDDPIEYGLLYKDVVFDCEDNHPLERLGRFFNNYRSLLYAVHRTSILRIAYQNAGSIVKNLYLNEYLSGIVPVIAGKYKELPILYQVREFADDSDDKTTPNLDKIVRDRSYQSELDGFINLTAANISSVYPVNEEKIKNSLSHLLIEFSRSPLIGENKRQASLKKRIGAQIKHIPFGGKWLIEKNRMVEKKRKLEKIYRMEGAKQNIEEVSRMLKKYKEC